MPAIHVAAPAGLAPRPVEDFDSWFDVGSHDRLNGLARLHEVPTAQRSAYIEGQVAAMRRLLA